MLQKDSESLK